MTAPNDLSELWIALREAWLADSLLTPYLATAQGGSIYLEQPHNKVPFPLLTLKILDPDLPIGATFLDLSDQTIQLVYYTLDRWAGPKVFAALQSNWSIPLTRTDAFESDNYQISNMQWSGPFDLGKLRISNIDQDFWGYGMRASCRVKPRDTTVVIYSPSLDFSVAENSMYLL